MRLILALFYTVFLVIRPGWSNTKSTKISFPITLQNTKISINAYSRYIRPQLKNILSEFYDVLIMEEREFKNFIPVRKKIKSLHIRINRLADFCEGGIDLCKQELGHIRTAFQPLEAQMFKVEKSLTKIKPKPEEDKESNFTKLWEVSQRGKTRKDVHELSSVFNEMTNMMDIIELNLRQDKFDKVSYLKLKKENNDLIKKINFMIWKMLPIQKQEIFRSAWINFFQKVEKYAVNSSDPTYLKENLETLNFNWNFFHMQMAKGHLKSKKRVVSMIRQIHRRWNSILKLILG